MEPDLYVDTFAGPGGWDVAAHQLGLAPCIGLEWEATACQTRAAAGHLTIRADVAQYPTAPFVGRTRGLIGSPPCQAWSGAGKGLGVKQDKHLVHICSTELAHGVDRRAVHLARCADPRSLLVVEPVRWVYDVRPRWVALEQVPQVLPLWRHFATLFSRIGYSCWTGIVNSADYGVPQKRHRAVLLASLDRPRLGAPPPTHAEHGTPPLRPWVTVEDVLDVEEGVIRPNRGAGRIARHGPRPDHPSSEPAPTVIGKARSWTYINGTQANAAVVPVDRPAPTVHFGHRANDVRWSDGQESRRVTPEEAATLQSFPCGYPWRGSRTSRFEQIGNAVPPGLALHLLAHVSGVALPPGV